MFVGVDGCPAGWIAVSYDDTGYTEGALYNSVADLWSDYGSAELILIDIPIGLREDSNEQRPCDRAARKCLSPVRHRSVFAVPVREAVYEDSYKNSKATQERLTDGSLGTQSWGIVQKIRELDTFLRNDEPTAQQTIRESHPELCFWALNDRRPTEYSKTSQPASAFWERVRILEEVDSDVLSHLADAGANLDAKVRNDDLIDALVLALTASSLTDSVRKLPADWPEVDSGDPTGLPMEMVYAFSRNSSSVEAF